MIKKLFFLLVLISTFSFFVVSTYARTVPPPPTTFYGVYINQETGECSIVKIEDSFFIYEYPQKFKLNENFSAYQSMGELMKICDYPNGTLYCHLGKKGDDRSCKSEYQKLVGSNTGYDKCQLTHSKCAVETNPATGINLTAGYRDYTEIKAYNKILKPSMKSKYFKLIGFILFAFLLLPAFNIFILTKRIFPKILRILILVLSILFWIGILSGWLYLPNF